MRSSIVLLLLFVLSVPSIITVIPVHAGSKTIVVPDDYSSIQDAVGNASEGDTVYVRKGVYVENPVINKSISLVGEDWAATVLDVTAGLKVQKDGVTVTGLTIYDGYDGISLAANYCNISGNKITDTTHGVVVFGYENSISGNIFESIGLSSAIQLNFANRNLISKNCIVSCVEGIQIWQNSNNNTITENTITNCKNTAINFQYSNGNVIVGNNISRSGFGTSIYGSSNNTILNNNYISNAIQFSANEEYYLSFGHNRSVNTINQNYWSDYNGNDNNGDGIGDTSYVIDEHNQDNNPLMTPVAITEAPYPSPPIPTPFASPTSSPSSALPLNLIILSPANTTYTTNDIPLTFVVDNRVLGKLNAGVDYSLDGSGNRAYILGNTTLPGLPEGSHCVTVYAYDGTGNEVSETVYFSVQAPAPFPTVTVVAAFAAAAVVGIGLLVYFKKRQRRAEPS
jgi:nitrous oxidase accessory protein